jgi:hypothetical protein
MTPAESKQSQYESMMEIMQARIAGSASEPITILFEFRKVTLVIPEMDVRASVGEGSGGMADGFAVTFKKEYTLVNVVTVVHRNVTISGFGSPQLRRNINDKGMSGRKEG